MWLAKLDKMRKKENDEKKKKGGRLHAHIVQRKLGNKVSIVVFTFQVIYQYSGIVTGYERFFHYPEPALFSQSQFVLISSGDRETDIFTQELSIVQKMENSNLCEDQA